jgi:sulfopyruvate decarboxylase alpha subunit
MGRIFRCSVPDAGRELGHSASLVNKTRGGRMNATDMAAEAASAQRTWHEIVRETLKRNDVRLAVYVPDNVLGPLIKGLHADPFFTCFTATREEEAVGIVSGAAMGGMRGIVLMQTSGFATLANVLASLPLVFNIPVLMMVSERGTLGEFNIGQTMVHRTMRPVLDALSITHHTITRLDEVEFIVERSIRQAMSTRAPACLILSPLLTGGKVLAK